MGYPAYVSEGSTLFLSTSGSGSVSWPAHITGDLGILVIGQHESPSAGVSEIPSISVPVDWTEIAIHESHLPPPPSRARKIQVYYKVATSSAEAAVSLSSNSRSHVF